MKNLALAAGVVVALVAAGPMFISPKTHVERSIDVLAGPQALWPDVAALATWPEWTQWSVKNDPGYDPTPEGEALGVGSTLRWTKSQGGPGTQRITEADPQRGVKYVLEIQGGKFAIDGRIAFEPRGEHQTRVTWSDDMDFSASWLGRYFTLMMDAMLGPKLEQSLLTLKQRAEARK